MRAYRGNCTLHCVALDSHKERRRCLTTAWRQPLAGFPSASNLHTLAAVAKYATPHSGDRAALRAIGAGLAVHVAMDGLGPLARVRPTQYVLGVSPTHRPIWL